MPGEGIQLDYAKRSKPGRRFLHIFILPLLWLPAGVGSRFYYGDEYGGFVLTNIPALPLMFLLNHLRLPSMLLIAMGFNFLLMVSLGHLMDRVRTPLWAYLIFFVLAAIAILSGTFIPGNIPPITPPRGARFHPVSLCPAWAISLYLFAVFAILLSIGSRRK